MQKHALTALPALNESPLSDALTDPSDVLPTYNERL